MNKSAKCYLSPGLLIPLVRSVKIVSIYARCETSLESKELLPKLLYVLSLLRIYGDKANDIIEGLKKNPVIAVPLVLRR